MHWQWEGATCICGCPHVPTTKRKYGCVLLSLPYSLVNSHTHSTTKKKDHAPGSLLIEEAGGVIGDSRGNPLNFGLGRTLGKNYGIIACGKWVHPKVLDAVKVTMKENRKRAKSREAHRAAAAAAAAATSTPEADAPDTPHPPPPPYEETPKEHEEAENKIEDSSETAEVKL